MKAVKMIVKCDVDNDVSLDTLNKVAEKTIEVLDTTLGDALHGVYVIKFSFEATDPLPSNRE